MTPSVPTRMLIISDTHGDAVDIRLEDKADVAIHCGDLTEESKLSEFKAAIQLLKALPAEIKLVIAGNHDFALDISAFKNIMASADPLDADLIRQEYGAYGEAEALLEEARDAGVIFLHEGIHQIELKNGARMKVYASPYTPSTSNWGFAYHPEQDHTWDIPPDTDVVVTHGPPQGILDYTDSKQRAGSASLFEAIAGVRPQLHCFGHIHEGWGARLVQWRRWASGQPSHFTSIDNDQSHVVETLSTLERRQHDTDEMAAEKQRRREGWHRQSYCICDRTPAPNQQTLFVNAAIESAAEDRRPQLPWLVEIALPTRE